METPTTTCASADRPRDRGGLVDAGEFLAVTQRLHALREQLAAAGLPPDRHRALHARLHAIAAAATASLSDAGAQLDALERDLTETGRG